MLARESGNLIETTNQVSVLELALGLVAEWRIVVAGVTLGLLISVIAYLGSHVTYTANMMVLVGNTYGEHAPTPLETPFLAARRIALRFGGTSGETIKTKIYEDDFDQRKRMTLEISITTASPERSLDLAGQIANFLRKDHERLYQEASAAVVAANIHNRKMAALEERLVSLYRSFYLEQQQKVGNRQLDDAENIFATEARGWAEGQEHSHEIRLKNYHVVMDRNRPKPTTFPLMPDRSAITKSVPDLKIFFLSGGGAGLFFGVIGAALIQAWRRAGAEI